MTTLTYRGYTAKVEVDVEDEILVGRILGINDVVGFHADTPKELKAAFEEAVEDYLVTCEKAGKEPEKSYSGKMMFRVDPAIHRQAAIAAEVADQSLNEWGEDALRVAVERWLPEITANLDQVGLARLCVAADIKSGGLSVSNDVLPPKGRIWRRTRIEGDLPAKQTLDLHKSR